MSVDSFASQKAFAEANGGISFKLLADFHPKGAVAQSYGIYNEDRGVAGRSSFVIDSEGVILDARTYPPGELPDPQELLSIAKGEARGGRVSWAQVAPELLWILGLFSGGSARMFRGTWADRDPPIRTSAFAWTRPYGECP